MEPQQPVREAVEGAEPQCAPGNPEQRLDARAHFGGRLIGEGDCQDPVRCGAFGLYQPGDPVDQHPGLAAPGPGQHKRGRER